MSETPITVDGARQPEAVGPRSGTVAPQRSAGARPRDAAPSETTADTTRRFVDVPITEHSTLTLYRGTRSRGGDDANESSVPQRREGAQNLAASYERKSKTDPFGIGEQYHLNSATATQEGFTIPNSEEFRFSDDDWSGTTSRRPGFERLMATVLSGTAPFTRVYVKDRTRWGRWKDPRMHHHLEVQLELHDVRLRYCDERDIAFDSASDDDVMSTALQGLIGNIRASKERDQMIKRTQGAIRHRILMGYYPGTMAPYGTVRVLAKKSNKDELLHPVATTEHGVVRRPDCSYRLVWGTQQSVERIVDIFRRFDAGQSLSSIARELNAEGIASPIRLQLEARARHPRPPREGPRRLLKLGPPCQQWTLNSVRSILSNPIYVGTLVWGMRRLAAGDTPATALEARTTRSTPLVLDDFMPSPPITRELWTAVQLRLLDNARYRRRQPSQTSPFLLSGLLRCAICDAPIFGFTRKERKGARYYRHRPERTSRAFDGVCPHRQRYQRAEPLEACVNTVAGELLAPEVLRTLAKKELESFLKARSSQRQLQEHARLESELALLDTNCKQAATNAAGAASDHARKALLEVVHETGEKYDAVRRQLEAMGRETTRLAALRTEIRSRAVQGLNLPQRFQVMGTATRKQVLRALMESITLQFESAELELRVRALPSMPATLTEDNASPATSAA